MLNTHVPNIHSKNLASLNEYPTCLNASLLLWNHHECDWYFDKEYLICFSSFNFGCLFLHLHWSLSTQFARSRFSFINCFSIDGMVCACVCVCVIFNIAWMIFRNYLLLYHTRISYFHHINRITFSSFCPIIDLIFRQIQTTKSNVYQYV